MRAAIYARKSTAQLADPEDKSVTRQIENARAFAAQKGWQVLDEHVYADDGISGAASLTKLVQKARMLAAIQGGSGKPPFDVLIMQSNDRLSRRDGDESFGELKQISRAGVQPYFYSDGTRFQYGDFASNTLGFLKGEFAAEFRRAIAAKTREAMEKKARDGHVTGGRVYGYDNVRVNSHTERRKNDVEAATVLRIYELYAGGHGLATIAHMLNAAGAPCPRAQQGRVSGWAPASVREILRRRLYRGEIVWGKNRKRADSGERGVRQPETAWLRIPAEHLRIVPEKIAEAVDSRFSGQKNRALRTRDGRLIGRPPGEASPYLLTGLLTCGACGGAMEVVSSKSGSRRVFSYRCATRRRKGAAVCTNAQPALMADTDEAIMRAIESTLLDPRVVRKAIEHAERAIARDRNAVNAESLEQQLRACQKAISRVTAAIASGDDHLPTLVKALETAERHRLDVEGRLESARQPQPQLDSAAVRAQLEAYIDDWQGLLRGHVQQGKQIIKRLINGRITMTPVPAKGLNRPYYSFAARGNVKPLLVGVVRNLASPTGFEPVFWP